MNISQNKSGQFIVLEGGEGVGKSTNLAFIGDYLKSKGIPFITTREPGGTPIAEDIRQIILKENIEKIDPKTELLLIFAARNQHLQNKILPNLNAGTWVLCDRFTDSTYAYQGAARGLDLETIELLEQMVVSERRPDSVIILDGSIELSNARLANRGIEKDRLEKESEAFHQSVLSAYRARSQQFDHYHLVDASQTLQAVQSDILSIINTLIE